MTYQGPKQIKVPDYTASGKQTDFHTTTADEALFGGAAGPGKTAALVAEAITTALEYPGIPVDLFRRTIPMLKSSVVPEIHKQTAEYINAGHLRYDGVNRQFKFANGSVLNLNYLDTPMDIYRYQGQEMPILLFDELTQFPQDWYEYLKTRNRTSNHDWPVRVRATSNPGGIGHGWVKRVFIDSAPWGKIHADHETGLTQIFIPASIEDHPDPVFREQYKRKLMAIKDQALRRALLNGDWDVFSGQVFTEWRREKNGKPWHVIEPFAIPDHWPRWFSYDHGYNTYASGSWFARDPQTNRKYKYRELYVTRTGVSEIARQIKQIEAFENVPLRLADPSIWKGAGNQNTGETVAAMFEKEGIFFQPANNDRMAGKAAFHEALSTAPDGLPWLQYFSSCVHSIRTIPSLPYDLIRVEDVDTKAEDHIYDSDRYGLVAERPRGAEKVKPFVPDWVQQASNNRGGYM